VLSMSTTLLFMLDLKFAVALRKCRQEQSTAVKYHFFREKVDLLQIRVVHIYSAENAANAFTKGCHQRYPFKGCAKRSWVGNPVSMILHYGHSTDERESQRSQLHKLHIRLWGDGVNTRSQDNILISQQSTNRSFEHMHQNNVMNTTGCCHREKSSAR
jgi:hypothetical protein